MKIIKSEKGMTLASLIIYIIALLAVMGTIATITSYFYASINNIGATVDVSTEYTNLQKFIVEEINKENNKVVYCTSERLVFSDGAQFELRKSEGAYEILDSDDESYKENQYAIYLGKVRICSYLAPIRDSKTFEHYITEDGKEVLDIDIRFMDETNRTAMYVLK